MDDELGGGDRLLDDLRDAVISMRTLPLGSIAGHLPRAVRDLAHAEGKQVRLEMVGADTQLDRVILDGISENIVHLLRNSISHGIESPDERVRAGKPETARVELRAEPRGDLVAVTVSDDGRGVSEELVRQGEAHGSLAEVLAQAGLSTADGVTELAGRGVGLDAVKRHVESLGGSLVASSRPGHGSEMSMLLPLTTSFVNLLLLERGGQVYGLPLGSVSEVLSVTKELRLGGRRSIDLRGASVALVDLADVVGADVPPPDATPLALVMNASGRQLAVICDRVLGEEEAVVKTLGSLLRGVPGYLGAAVRPDGRIALILDPAFVSAQRTSLSVSLEPSKKERQRRRMLVVDDEFTVRELQRSILEAAGYDVVTARNGREALEALSGDERREAGRHRHRDARDERTGAAGCDPRPRAGTVSAGDRGHLARLRGGPPARRRRRRGRVHRQDRLRSGGASGRGRSPAARVMKADPPVRVMICDDSPAYARGLARFLEYDGDLRVVGVCASAAELIATLPELPCDLITMDLELPDADGVSTIEQIMSSRPRPILALSAHTGRGSRWAPAALAAGALDAIYKGELRLDSLGGAPATALRRRIKRLARVPLTARAGLVSNGLGGERARGLNGAGSGREATVIGIGSSTGGPAALVELLSQLAADFPLPVLVVQHISPGFTEGLGALDRRSRAAAGRARSTRSARRPGSVVRPG